MYLVVKLSDESRELVEILSKQKIVAKLVKGGTLIEPTYLSEIGCYVLPPEIALNARRFYLNTEEKGGGYTKTGNAQIVCGASGKKLHPYLVKTFGTLACEEHALFSVPESVVLVTCERCEQKISIVRYEVDSKRVPGDETLYFIKETVLWEGRFSDLPHCMGQYRAAVNAAEEKSRCYHCREPHYAL